MILFLKRLIKLLAWTIATSVMISIAMWISLVAGILAWVYTDNPLLSALASSAAIGASFGIIVTYITFHMYRS